MSKKKSTQIKFVVIIVALIGFAIAGKLVYDQQVAGAEFNRLVQLANDGEFKSAVDGFEKLIQTAPSNIAAKAKLEAAPIYVILGEDTGTGFADMARYYRRAEELKPGSINVEQRKIVDTAQRSGN